MPDELSYYRMLDPEEVAEALWRTHGSVTDASAMLCVSSLRLRTYVNSKPELRGILTEMRERLADRAEEVVREALYSNDPSRKDVMAKYVLSSAHGEPRGYSRASNVSIQSNGPMVISWGDGSSVTDDEYGKVIEFQKPVPEAAE